MIYLNGQPVVPTIFPDKTSQVWKLSNYQEVVQSLGYAEIKWQFESESEFIHLAQLKTLLSSINCTLILTYLPYGRQDKNICNTATFGLLTFANLLNSLDFKEVIIHDPHSERALERIRNSRAVYPIKKLSEVIADIGANLICYPDKGALLKYAGMYNMSYIWGDKVRDQLTGNITSYKVLGDPSGKNVLIVDDICDGGMTFKLLARDLLAAGAKEVNLFVTHGLFSKGLRTLYESGIKRVFTEDGEAGKRS